MISIGDYQDEEVRWGPEKVVATNANFSTHSFLKSAVKGPYVQKQKVDATVEIRLAYSKVCSKQLISTTLFATAAYNADSGFIVLCSETRSWPATAKAHTAQLTLCLHNRESLCGKAAGRPLPAPLEIIHNCGSH